MERESRAEQPVPGDALLHPVAIAAIAVLVLNDHFLKSAAPGLITGKLSDFAGLTFFPLLLLSGWELALALIGRWRGPTLAPLVLAVASTALVFGLVKTTSAGAVAFATSLGWMQSLAGWPLAVLAGDHWMTPRPVAVVQDPTDLVAVVFLVVSLAIGFTRITGPPARLSRRDLAGEG